MAQFEQRGGALEPLFSVTYHEIGVPRQWQRRTAQQSRFEFSFKQLRNPHPQDDLGQALIDLQCSHANCPRTWDNRQFTSVSFHGFQ